MRRVSSSVLSSFVKSFGRPSTGVFVRSGCRAFCTENAQRNEFMSFGKASYEQDILNETEKWYDSWDNENNDDVSVLVLLLKKKKNSLLNFLSFFS